MKRLVDIVVASVALLLLSPVFLLVAYKVRKNLGSPIFFYQERPGKDGKLFKMMKFRSMKDANDAPKRISLTKDCLFALGLLKDL